MKKEKREDVYHVKVNLLQPNAYELLEGCHNKVDVLFWNSTWKLKVMQMIDALMEEYMYSKCNEEFGIRLMRLLHCFQARTVINENNEVLTNFFAT